MKILRIIARLNVGGPAKHVVWLTERMRRRGHESLLIAGTVPDGEADMTYFADLHGVKPIYLREMSRELSLRDAVSLWKLYRIMHSERPDIVHTHTAKAGTVGRIAAFVYRWGTWQTLIGKPRRVRVVHTFHGHVLYGYYGRAMSRLFLAIERILARFATDKIVAISPQQLDELNCRFGIGHSDKFQLIPLGIDLEDSTGVSAAGGLRENLGASRDTLLLAFIGRLTEIKDVPLLLQAVHEYKQVAHGLRLMLAIIGDGHLRAELEDLVKSLDLGREVTFLRNREDVGELVSDVDIVVLASKNEGTPLSLIEAMSVGVPVVATSVGGVVDLLGKTVEKHEGFDLCERGIAVNTRSPKDFASALIYTAQNEKLRTSLSDVGRRYVIQNYSIDRLEDDLARLYDGLMRQEGSISS